MQHISLEIGTGGVATMTLDNADGPNNLVSSRWIAEMEEAIAALSANEAVSGVILRSAKKTFMAGADLKWIVEGFESRTATQAFEFALRANRMHRAIEHSGKPWVAIIAGAALGGGFELALACHRRILADDARAVVGLPEVKLALLPGSGGTQRVPRMCGIDAAVDLLLSGRTVAGQEALDLGIVDEIASPGELEDMARAWLASEPDHRQPWDRDEFIAPAASGMLDAASAATFAQLSARVSGKADISPAEAAIVSCLFEGLQLPFDRALEVESKYFAKLLVNPISRNIIRTTFLSKSAAEKGAGRPEGQPAFRADKVGVIGAGMMGSGIALVSALSCATVILIDREDDAAQAGKAYSEKVLRKDIVKGRRAEGSEAEILDRIIPTTDFALLEGCDLVVEAVFEDAEIKNEITRRAERVLGESAVYATNTSTLPISGLAEASSRPQQFIGLHFFSPVDRMGLVEVIRGRETSQATLAKALDFVSQLRKTPIVVNDSRGFYTSRVFETLTHEACAMLSEGVPAPVIENVARQIGMPVGPLALLDELTFDLPLRIVDQAIAQEGSAYRPPAGTTTLRKMFEEIGRNGRKAGGGFYEYPIEGPKRLWPGLKHHFPESGNYDVEELKRRFLFVQSLASARCLEEGVIQTPQDGDLGSVLGWGFPAWTGGTISYIDTVGLRIFVEQADRLAERHGERFAPTQWLRERARAGQSFYPVEESDEPACAA